MGFKNLILGAIFAGILFIIAYLIWYKKQVWLISGDTEHVKDKDKLAKCMGIFLIIAGIYFFLVFALIYTIPHSIFTISFIAFCIITLTFRIVIYKKIK